jgi:hypothetical protein
MLTTMEMGSSALRSSSSACREVSETRSRFEHYLVGLKQPLWRVCGFRPRPPTHSLFSKGQGGQWFSRVRISWAIYFT